MDYEKKYKEAVERAKQFITKELYAECNGNLVEYIFPELKESEESEDERIRKAIHIYLDWLDGRKDYAPRGEYTIRDMIAWLERQKEYESTDFEYVWNRTDCGDLTSALDKYSEEAIINMCHAWYDKGIELERKSWLEKQGNTFSKKDVDDAYLKGICNTKHELEKQGDQKSVDKEYTFKSIPRLLDMIEPTDRAKSYCKKLIDSLQTEGYSVDAKIVGECLKQMNGEKVAMAVMDTEKQDEQKPQRMVSSEAKEALYDKPTDEEMKELLRTEYEKGRADTIAEMKSSWSEVDDIRLQACIDCLQAKSLMGKVDTVMTNWLKSLKDRYTWKPSEEQIECLHDAIEHYQTNGYPASKLNELYEQMSKIYKL